LRTPGGVGLRARQTCSTWDLDNLFNVKFVKSVNAGSFLVPSPFLESLFLVDLERSMEQKGLLGNKQQY
jgi:hypothetical protein